MALGGESLPARTGDAIAPAGRYLGHGLRATFPRLSGSRRAMGARRSMRRGRRTARAAGRVIRVGSPPRRRRHNHNSARKPPETLGRCGLPKTPLLDPGAAGTPVM